MKTIKAQSINRLLIGLLTYFLFSQFAFATTVELNSIERIKSKNQLVVAMMNQEIPPFFMKNDEGEWVGFDIELAENIGPRSNSMLEFAATY